MDEKLDVWLTDGQRAHPSLRVDAEGYRQHVHRLLSERPGVSSVHAADLFLAYAAGTGDVSAIERVHGNELSSALASLRRSDRPETIEDLRQELSVRLFSQSPERGPEILDYSGLSSLVRWLQVIAVHARMRHARRQEEVSASAAEETVLGRLPSLDNPELELLKRRYRESFDRAFMHALQQLDARARNVLRLHALEGLNIERIGALHQVHRATVARWIAAARRELLERTRADVCRELGLSASEATSLIRVLLSRIEVPLSAALTES